MPCCLSFLFGGIPAVAVYAANVLLTIPALWRLFSHMNLRPFWALVPGLRLYKLGQCADLEDAGLFWFLSFLAASLLLVCVSLEQQILGLSPEWLAVGALIFDAASLIYGLRVFFGLCRNLQRSRLWVLGWLLFSALPLLVWAFSRTSQPAPGLPVRAARESCCEEADFGSGLTINLRQRTVWSLLRRRVLLRDIHLHIRPGTMVLLLGGSGSGKTTLLNAITGYEKAKAKVLLDGEDVYRFYDRMKYRIGVVPQQDLMRYNDTVLRTLTDAAVLRLPESVSRRERSARVSEVLELFGLSSVKNSEVEKLSGGQKKRLSIAMEYISDPSLFLLDEPDSGLDGILARDLMSRLREITRQGKTVVVITHSPDRVLELFDDVIVLGKDARGTGRLVFFGAVEEARSFFDCSSMEEILRKINRPDEGGEGRTDELIERFAEVRHGS